MRSVEQRAGILRTTALDFNPTFSVSGEKSRQLSVVLPSHISNRSKDTDL